MSHQITAPSYQSVGVRFETESVDEPAKHNSSTTKYFVTKNVHTQGVQCYKEGHSGVTIIESRRVASRGDDF